MYAERQRQHELPAERHELVVAEARQRPADPHEDEDEEQDLRRRRTPSVSSVLSTVCGATLSHSVNGMSQPPKNSVAISALAVIMFAYSAMKNIENFIALYSE